MYTHLSRTVANAIAVNGNDCCLWRGVDDLVAGGVLGVPHVRDGVLGLDEGVSVQGCLNINQDVTRS